LRVSAAQSKRVTDALRDVGVEARQLTPELEAILEGVHVFPEDLRGYLKRNGIRLPAFWFTNEQVDDEIIPEQPRGRRDCQIARIKEVADTLKIDFKQPPHDHKKQIKEVCIEDAHLFTSDGFDHAWKEFLRRRRG
jgi:hypothetical protein